MLREVVGDQALMLQLTPEAMEVFNASVGQRPGVRYGSIVAQATRPTSRSTIGAGLDAGAQVTRALFGALYPLAAATQHRLAPRLAPEVARVLRHAYGAIPSAADNDGIVPTRSQAWGDVLHAVDADHLDVLGHFGDASHDPPHVDWLVSGSGVNRPRFEALWEDVSRFLVCEGAKHRGGEAEEIDRALQCHQGKGRVRKSQKRRGSLIAPGVETGEEVMLLARSRNRPRWR